MYCDFHVDIASHVDIEVGCARLEWSPPGTDNRLNRPSHSIPHQLQSNSPPAVLACVKLGEGEPVDLVQTTSTIRPAAQVAVYPPFSCSPPLCHASPGS